MKWLAPKTLKVSHRHAFQARFRLVHGVLRRLGVIKNDSRKGLELLVDSLDQRSFGAMRPVHGE